MKVILTALLFFISLLFYGQEYYFINAESGLNVRTEANLSSKKIGKIRFGAMVEKIADSDVTLTVTDNGKLITGKFVKIKYNEMYLPVEGIEGYVFDGYLKKEVNEDIINVSKIEEVKYKELLKSVSKVSYNPKKITDLSTVKTMLNNKVEWFEDGYIKSIKLNNGQKLLFDETMIDFGFVEGNSSYYPDEEILVLEGGHSIDICFSLKTGETELTIGNPAYIASSPKSAYRLNGHFGGQECVSYFIQKKENGKFEYVTAFNVEDDICQLKEFHWTSENEFIFTKFFYSTETEKEYFKGSINIQSKKNDTKKPDFNEIINGIELKNTTITDTTNFDNFKRTNFYNKSEVQVLHLDKIYPNFYKEGYNYKATSSYKVNLSHKFHSVVFTTFKGEHEMESTLVTYELDGRIIDSKAISYDEIAESRSRKHSKINNDVITIIDEFYGNTKEVDTAKFHINKNGEINQIRTKFSSSIRPRKSIVLNKIYTDTIKFSEYIEGGDYYHLSGNKNGIAVSLVYNWEWYKNEKYNFKAGERIKVEWKMDSIYIAGDGETLDFEERAIDAEKIESNSVAIKNIESRAGLIMPNTAFKGCCVYIPDSGLKIYDQPNGNSQGRIYLGKSDNNNEYYTAQIETNGVVKTLESSNLKMVGYEVFALVFEDSKSGFLKLKNGYWLNADEIIAKNLKLTSWADYIVEKNTEWYAYDLGLNLREGPSTKHNKIVTLKGDLFGITMTNEKKGKWQKVNVKQYRKHPCSGEDNLILKTCTGWIKLISEDETPNVWDYAKGC